MKPRAARRRFFAHLRGYGGELGLLTPATGLELMLRTYRYDRFRGCDPASGDDLLFCDWSFREQDRSERFAFRLTRRLIDDDKLRPSIRHLSLSFLFHPDGELRSLGTGRLKCDSPESTESFRAAVEASPAYQFVKERPHRLVDLFFGPVR